MEVHSHDPSFSLPGSETEPGPGRPNGQDTDQLFQKNTSSSYISRDVGCGFFPFLKVQSDLFIFFNFGGTGKYFPV